MSGVNQVGDGFPVNQNPNQGSPQVPPASMSVPSNSGAYDSASVNAANLAGYGFPPPNSQAFYSGSNLQGDSQLQQPQPVSSPGYPPAPYPSFVPNVPVMNGNAASRSQGGSALKANPVAGVSQQYSDEPMDVRKVAHLAEEQHPDLADLRTRVPFNMPGLVPASASRSSRRKKRQSAEGGNQTSHSAAGSGSGLAGFTLPGDPNAALSFKELLGQPVSNVAASTIASPKELEDSDGLQFRAVGLSVGSVPEPDIRYPIPYIAREHPSYYTGYEISLIMESIRDSEHARQVLARIVAVPRWVRWVISLFGGWCGAAVSALNGFLSLIAFAALMVVVLIFTYSFASRIGSGRFYDPTGYKTIWLGAFMPIGLLSAIIAARSLVPQPWLALLAFVVTTICGVIWTTWIQEFQIKRLLSSEIRDAGEA